MRNTTVIIVVIIARCGVRIDLFARKEFKIKWILNEFRRYEPSSVVPEKNVSWSLEIPGSKLMSQGV